MASPTRRQHRVIRGPKTPIGTRTADLHVVTTDLMEAKRRPPPVAQFTLRIDRRMVVPDEAITQRIVSRQRRGDITVFADWITAAREIGAPSGEDVIDKSEIPADVTTRGVE